MSEAWDRLPIFVGTYTFKHGHIFGESEEDEFGDGVYVVYLQGDGLENRTYKFTDNSPMLAHEPGVAGKSPVFFRIMSCRNDASKKKLLVANDHDVTPGATVQTFDISADHKISTREQPVSVKMLPVYIGISLCKRYMTVPSYLGGNSQSFRLDEDNGHIVSQVADIHHGKTNSSGEILKFVRNSSQNPHRQDATHPHCFIYVPTFMYSEGNEGSGYPSCSSKCYALAADLGADEVIQFEQDLDTGAMKEIGRSSVEQGAGPRHIIFHPSGKWVYVINELHCSISVFEFHSDKCRAGGAFLSPTPIHSASLLPEGWQEDTAKEKSPLYEDLKKNQPEFIPVRIFS